MVYSLISLLSHHPSSHDEDGDTAATHGAKVQLMALNDQPRKNM